VWSGRIVERLGTMSRPLIWALQRGIFALSGITAFLLRFDLRLAPRETARLVYALRLRPARLDCSEDHRISDCSAGPPHWEGSDH
jgi:hypothetical protein